MNNNEKMSASRLHSSGNQHGIKFFMIVFLTIFISLLSACATTPNPDPEPEPEPDPMDIVVEFPGDHLKEPVGTVTIGNETIDLAKLKQEKGDLYRFYEPLTEQEIKDMHKIHTDYTKKEWSLLTQIWLSPFGYDKKDLNENDFNALITLESEITDKFMDAIEKIYKNELPGLEKFKNLITSSKNSDGLVIYSLPSDKPWEMQDPLLIEFFVRGKQMHWDLFLEGVKVRNLNYKPILFSNNNVYI